MAGHIEPREDVFTDHIGPWCRVVVPIGGGRGAKKRSQTVRASTPAKTRKAAESLLAEWCRQAEDGFIPPTRLMLSDLLNRWLAHHVDVYLAARTAYVYRCIVESHLIPAFERFRAVDLRPASMQEYYATKRKAKLSDAAIHYHYRTMHAALAWAVGTELVARNICDVREAKPPRGKAPEMKTLSAAQMLGLLAAIEGTDLYLPVMLAVATGMRRGEVCGLRRCDVDLDAGTVRIASSMSAVPGRALELKATKTERVRIVGLPAFAVVVLKAVWRDRVVPADSYVVDMGPNKVTRLWRETVNGLGLDGVRFHDLRHSYASQLLANGGTVKETQEALGHTKASTTMDIYAHVTDAMREHRSQVVNRMFDVASEAVGESGTVKPLR